MPGRPRARLAAAYGLVTHSLSGRLLLLTVLYVMVAEVLIFVPSVGRYHRELLDNHIESAELAVLPFTEPGGDQLPAATRQMLLKRAGASSVLLQSADRKQLFQIDEKQPWIDATIDLTAGGIGADMIHALDCLWNGGARSLHVIAPTRIAMAQNIGIILSESPIRAQLVAYADRVMVTGLIVSLITALLVFASLYLVLVRPMRRITEAMVAFRDNPEDPARIVQASARQDEIGIAERELAAMQRDLYGFLQQKTRLAALGAAMARIQHDLRNILSNAQLASDRLSTIDDPMVKKLAPRLVASIDRAVSLATNTLRYGRADERPPQRKFLCLAPLIAEAGEAAIEARIAPIDVVLDIHVEDTLQVDADAEQLYRMVLNLSRNAVEAIVERGTPGRIAIKAERFGQRVRIEIADNGPGIPANLHARLFQPFATAARSGGSGLGLAIARDLARAHGGDIVLVSTGETGTTFRLELPDRELL
ncbi:MAG TPA: HAMP domain-containing sensor histidine kinase [Rhizomicrobium sp.]|jgi:signal transduction histidine kinase|nr:HAMP domain-containing sensor histidine kinase [Rhizomicrobium sp.]